MDFDLSNFEALIPTGPNHGYIPVTRDDNDEMVGIYEWHLNPRGELCAMYFTVWPCCDGDVCPHWTTIDHWDPLTVKVPLNCPSCGITGRIVDGRWVDS